MHNLRHVDICVYLMQFGILYHVIHYIDGHYVAHIIWTHFEVFAKLSPFFK